MWMCLVEEIINYKYSLGRYDLLYTPIEYLNFDSKLIPRIKSKKIQIIPEKKRINILDWKSLNDQEKEFVFFSGFDIYEVRKFQ